tara:strand:- start:192 stop:293 length:102 start_codon:yes stop_codon:yes gene_type:complete
MTPPIGADLFVAGRLMNLGMDRNSAMVILFVFT